VSSRHCFKVCLFHIGYAYLVVSMASTVVITLRLITYPVKFGLAVSHVVGDAKPPCDLGATFHNPAGTKRAGLGRMVLLSSGYHQGLVGFVCVD
jgi:hypothetical protein